MLPNLATDKGEREQILVIQRICVSLVGHLIGTFGLEAVNLLGKGNNQEGFFWISVIIAEIFVVTISITVFNVKEKMLLKNLLKNRIKASI